jgi:predicted AlkP superfamily pyrophosphatase or phosphodiesterase
MSKVILVLCDGLRYDTAREMMGYMEHLVESQQAHVFKELGEMPTISRPMYETIHTGVPVSEHGVTSNLVVRPSRMPNIFSVAHEHGKVTAASAYFWFSELYNGCPYTPGTDKECDHPDLAIQHGRFYTTDGMPDEETFHAGQVLWQKYQPDYLLIHPMGMDNLGHLHGPESNQYRNNAILIDILLASYLPGWIDAGYTVLVSADHGMSRNNSHNGSLPETRDVPLYIFPSQRPQEPQNGAAISMLSLAPTVLTLMDLPVPVTMKHEAIRFR